MNFTEKLGLTQEIDYIKNKNTIVLLNKLKRLRRIHKDYIVNKEPAHLVKDKDGKYTLVIELFENQYNKLKNHRNKINYYLDKIKKGKNSLEIIFDKRVDF